MFGCRFIYYPPGNLSVCSSGGCGDLYLAADDGEFYWDTWSPVGPAGLIWQTATARSEPAHSILAWLLRAKC